MRNNGKAINLGADAVVPVSTINNAQRVALGFLPFTPVPFSGDEAWIAWLRIVLYSGIACYAFNRMRPASYISMGAAAVSLATSLTAGAWGSKV